MVRLQTRSEANKPKRKAHRKSIREAEERAAIRKQKSIDKWLLEWYESRADYPTKKRKRLTKEQYFKLLKQKHK